MRTRYTSTRQNNHLQIRLIGGLSRPTCRRNCVRWLGI